MALRKHLTQPNFDALIAHLSELFPQNLGYHCEIRTNSANKRKEKFRID